jgi:predicted RNA-binding protein with PUA-like domain
MPKPEQRTWLVKSEPQVYAITSLERDGTTGWEGVRNYQARNTMRDEMKPGDLVLFYHSNAEPPGVAGVAKVAGPPVADPSQFDPKSEYYDETSPKAEPRWVMCRLSFVERFKAVVPLEVLKADPKLQGMPLLQKGQRLSVQPVSPAHFARVLTLAGAKTKP